MNQGIIKHHCFVDGIIYGCIPTWGDHQYFNNKEADSKLPDVKKGKILKGRINQSTLTVHAKLSEDAFLRELNKNNSNRDRSASELSLNEESSEVGIGITNGKKGANLGNHCCSFSTCTAYCALL